MGRLLGGRYELIDVVGVGGMAVVYRARDTVLGRYVAIKILKEEFAKDPDIRKRFAIESRAVAKLSHHNIVSVYDVGNEDGTDYIVMELIEGVTLKEYLQQKGRLSWQESIFFAEQISSALVHAHSRGIIHQDIKPQNVIILRDGTAKLTDFGIASFATTQETRVVQEAIGSVHYISPEQAKGSKIDYRTDIYSLGVVDVRDADRQAPFEGENRAPDRHAAYQRRAADARASWSRTSRRDWTPSSCTRCARTSADAMQFGGRAVRRPCARARGPGHAVLLYRLGRQLGRDAGHRTGDCSAPPVSAAAEDTAAIRRHRAAAVNRTAHARRLRRAAAPLCASGESSDFFEKLSERPAMAAGMAVAVVAVISLLVVAVLMFTGGSKSAKIDVPDLIGRTIDDVYADSDVMNNFEIKEALLAAGIRPPGRRDP
ncbi:MAG: protein kinase domain-containing protein [Butyricicoccaceae bacterium]